MNRHHALTRLILVYICGLLALAPAPHAAHSAPGADAACAGGACQLYLPLIATPIPQPHLLAPAVDATGTALAPIFSWSAPITGTYRLEVSTEPTFATTTISTTYKVTTLPAQGLHVSGDNLDPATLYYWRVGVTWQGHYSYAPAITFTTQPKNDALLPPKPTLLAPANGASIPSTTATLTWQAVPGALYYRLRVYKSDGSTFKSALLAGNVTSYQVVKLLPATPYAWRVKVLNSYGWSSNSAPRVFTTQ